MIAKGKGAIIKIVSFRKSALRKRFSKDKIVYGFGIGWDRIYCLKVLRLHCTDVAHIILDYFFI